MGRGVLAREIAHRAELGSKNVGGALGSPNGRPGPLGGECTTSGPHSFLGPWTLWVGVLETPKITSDGV